MRLFRFWELPVYDADCVPQNFPINQQRSLQTAEPRRCAVVVPWSRRFALLGVQDKTWIWAKNGEQANTIRDTKFFNVIARPNLSLRALNGNAKESRDDSDLE